jgi:hypothetical protein
MVWKDLKICITDCEDEELELKLSFDFPISDWKKALISFVKSKPSLASRLSTVQIDKFQSWVEAVDYLRYQLDNPEEKSMQLQAVWSWLVMAANWFEIEDVFISEDGTKLRVSRSEGAVLPTRQLILNEFKMNRNIEIQEIAQKCGLTQRGIRYCIAKHEVLRKIYHTDE